MNELTERLTTEQPVMMGGLDPSAEKLRQRVTDVGYVSIEFTGTRGGTDLNIKVDHDATDLSGADFEHGSGTVHVEGTVTLNGDPVRCVADLDLATLKGTGRLVPVGESAATTG
ncbi:MAG TPA: hypothetical protein VGI74_27205 [Streptosporangiaceae bacterium]|jgi:hypothetical protein